MGFNSAFKGIRASGWYCIRCHNHRQQSGTARLQLCL